MSEHTKFIKRVGLIGIVKFIVSLRGIILFPILAKALGTANYGIWSQILITIGLALPFITLCLPETMVRFLAAKSEKKEVAKGIFTIVFFILITAIISTALLFLTSDYFANILLKDGSASIFVKVASLLIILGALNQASLESFRVFGQIKRYSTLTILQTSLEFGLVLLLLSLGFGLMGVIAAFIIADAIVLLISLLLILSQTGFSLPDFSTLRPYLAFSLPLIPVGFFDTFINSSDRYIIGFFKGASAVGIYSATYTIGILVVIFIYPISYILAPTIFKLFEDKQIDRVKVYLSYSLKYFLLLAIPSVFGLTILSKTILRSLATSEFILYNSMFIVLLVSLSAVFYGVQVIFEYILMLEKRTKFFMFAFGVGGIINLILNILFVPYMGIIGAALTTLIAYVAVAIIIYLESRKYLRFKIDFVFIAKSILASVIMAVIVFLINPIGIVKILLTVGVGAAVYLLILYLLKGFSSKELKIFGGALVGENLSEKY